MQVRLYCCVMYRLVWSPDHEEKKPKIRTVCPMPLCGVSRCSTVACAGRLLTAAVAVLQGGGVKRLFRKLPSTKNGMLGQLSLSNHLATGV